MPLVIKIITSYLFLVFVSLGVGIFIPGIGKLFSPYGQLILQSIFFLTALTIKSEKALEYLKDYKVIAAVSLSMLVLFPLATYGIALLLVPSLAIPLLLLSAMPAGMTAPLLAKIAGGHEDLALVLVVATSLLAPFTIPLVIQTIAGATISVGFMSMFLPLLTIIFVPFILAQIIKHFWGKYVQKIKPSFKFISEILLMLLITGIVAKQADVILKGFSDGTSWFYLGILFLFFIVTHFAGYFIVFWKHNKERIAITITLTYMNVTLAIYLADTFFKTPEIVVPVVLAFVPWALLLSPFMRLAKKRVSL